MKRWRKRDRGRTMVVVRLLDYAHVVVVMVVLMIYY